MPDLTSVYVPHLGREFKFQDRSQMRPPFVGRAARLPRRAGWEPPTTPLPVDSTGNGAVSCPIYGNDTYGDCGEAMLAHWYQILRFRQGQGIQFNFTLATLINQYLKESKGDNGLSEPNCVNILKSGVGGIADATAIDELDIDLTDTALMQLCIDNFYSVEMGWSVPNAFISGFASGSVWSSPGRPNPRNGHYTPIADVGGPDTPIPAVGPPVTGHSPRRMPDEGEMVGEMVGKLGGSLSGFYRLYTWGGWAWVSPEFIASVNPDGFVIFSAAQFDPATGLDSKGRHITTQAALWLKMGGKEIPASVLAQYPAPVAVADIDWSSWD